MDSVAKIIVDEFGSGTNENDKEWSRSLIVTEALPTPLSVYEEAFQIFIERQNEVNRKLLEKQEELIDQMDQRINDQQKYIQETLEKRDQQLMQTLREIHEIRRLEVEEQKPFWKRLLKK